LLSGRETRKFYLQAITVPKQQKVMSDSQEPNNLTTLAELAGRGSYPDIARWIVEYRYEQLLQAQDSYLEGLRTRYRELLNSYLRHHLMYEGHRKEQDYTYYKSLESLKTLAEKMLHLLDDDEVDKRYLQELVARQEFELLRGIFSSLRPNRPRTDGILDYERKLFSDHVFLLEELIGILTQEYDRRITDTRSRFESYLIPHRRAIGNIEEELRGIDADMSNLQKEPLLDPQEKRKLIGAFLQRRSELLAVERSEALKLLKVRLVSLDLRDSVNQFKSLIDSLRRVLDAYKVRQSYVEKLARLGARIPDFRNLLDSLYDTFRSGVGCLQKSFRIFDRSFQEMVFQAIDEQSVVNRILHSSGGVVTAELELMDILKHAPVEEAQPAFEAGEAVDPDLSFLRTYGEILQDG
jgi:hypothetical protein